MALLTYFFAGPLVELLDCIISETVNQLPEATG